MEILGFLTTILRGDKKVAIKVDESHAKFNARVLSLWAAQTTPRHSHFSWNTKREQSNKIFFVST